MANLASVLPSHGNEHLAIDLPFPTHEEIVRGGEISFDMASAQDYKWASGPEARPSSPMRQQQAVTGK